MNMTGIIFHTIRDDKNGTVRVARLRPRSGDETDRRILAARDGEATARTEHATRAGRARHV